MEKISTVSEFERSWRTQHQPIVEDSEEVLVEEDAEVTAGEDAEEDVVVVAVVARRKR